jgi:uncharacterized protein (DUF2147 family)
MLNKRFILKNVATIVACFVAIFMFFSCEKSSESLITSFNITQPHAVGDIDQIKKIIKVYVTTSDITNLVPEIVLSSKATINPKAGAPTNFTKPVEYFVTAQKGNTTKYTVTVIVDDITGKWARPDGMEITVDGNVGVFSKITSGIWLTLLNEGKLNLGDPKIKDISKTGKLSWTGKDLRYFDDLFWVDCNLTLNEQGNTLRVFNEEGGFTLTKIQ